jgi:hypothetical protein
VDCGKEVSGGFVIAGCDSAILLEPAEEILDEMACLIGVLVEAALDFAVPPWRDHERFSPCEQWFDHPLVCIKGFVCQQGIGRHVRQQRVGAFQIMGVARRELEIERVAQRIDERMNLGA